MTADVLTILDAKLVDSAELEFAELDPLAVALRVV